MLASRPFYLVTSVLALIAVVEPACPARAADTPATQPAGGAKVRVACVGDSITYGSGLKDREAECYPAQLQKLLGDGYEVRNFGVSGATMQRAGDKPYWKERAFEQAKAFRPEIVVIKLGTNDTKAKNWKDLARFQDDASDMLSEFAKLDPRPKKLYLCYPVPAFPGNFGIRDDLIKHEVVRCVAQVAEYRNVPVIDLYTALEGKAKLFPDKVHPNAEGARLIAEAVHQSITTGVDQRKPRSNQREPRRGAEVR